jgi:hypothetical protein
VPLQPSPETEGAFEMEPSTRGVWDSVRVAPRKWGERVPIPAPREPVIIWVLKMLDAEEVGVRVDASLLLSVLIPPPFVGVGLQGVGVVLPLVDDALEGVGRGVTEVEMEVEGEREERRVAIGFEEGSPVPVPPAFAGFSPPVCGDAVGKRGEGEIEEHGVGEEVAPSPLPPV